jgi:serine/threonine protein kinase
VTRSSVVLGTPHYMAPEQFERAAAVDHRADLFALGVVFYEMLTGERPQGLFKPPSQKAKVHRRLDAVVLKALAKEPELRFQSAAEFKQRLTTLGKASLSSAAVAEAEDANSASVYAVLFATTSVILWVGTLTKIAVDDLSLAKSLKQCLLPGFLSICWGICMGLTLLGRTRREKTSTRLKTEEKNNEERTAGS